MAEKCFPTLQELCGFGIDADVWRKFINGEIDEVNPNQSGVDVETILSWRRRVMDMAQQAAGMQTYLTKAKADAAQPQPPEVVAQVTNDPEPMNNGYWVSDGSQWIWSGIQPITRQELSSFQSISSKIVGRTPAFLDDFGRPEQRSTTLGLASSAWRWHNSGSFQIRNQIAQLGSGATRNNRYYARTGFTFKSYIAHITVEVGETFNFGWTYRQPDDSTTSNPRLFARIYLNAAGVNRIRLGYGTVGSTNDADTETLFDGEVNAIGKRSHEFTFVQDGPRVLAFVNGGIVMDHTISSEQNTLLGHSVGINALTYSSNEELKIRRVAVYRLHDKPANIPQVMAHRMVVKGPFGPDTYTTDTRDPESCLSALERLPPGVGIETDIRQSSDRHYILMHDPTVDRTTYGTGEVSAMTLAELTALKIRGLGGRNVPSLAELLQALEDRPDIPLAFLQLYGPNIADAINEINQASPGVKARCVLFVNNLGQAQGARNVDPDIRLAVGGRNNANESEIPDLVAAGVEIGVISPGDTSYAANRGQVAKLHAAGIKVFASTTQMHYTMRQIEADGTDGYLSDYPTGSAA